MPFFNSDRIEIQRIITNEIQNDFDKINTMVNLPSRCLDCFIS